MHKFLSLGNLAKYVNQIEIYFAVFNYQNQAILLLLLQCLLLS